MSSWHGQAQRAVVALAVAGWVALAAAQPSTLTTVKAAFLYNFANFAEWPLGTLSPKQTMALCVLGDTAVADALDQTVKGHTIKGHELTVEVVKADGKIGACHLLSASGLDNARTKQLLATLKGAAVLTVGDGDRFAESGGIVRLFVEHERMRFAINAAAAGRARIRLSSKILNLATLVNDDQDIQR